MSRHRVDLKVGATISLRPRRLASPRMQNAKELKSKFLTGSGLELKRFYTPSGSGRAGTTRSRPATRVNTPTRGAFTRRSTAAACGPCASTRASARRANRTRATAICFRKGKRASPSPSIFPPKSAWIRTIPWRAAKWAAWAWPSIRSRTWKRSSRVFPLERVSASMTINATARDSAGALFCRGGKAGRRSRPAFGNRPERHSEGIHRARNLHLSAALRPCAS